MSYMDGAIEDLSHSQYVAQMQPVSQDPVILRLFLKGGLGERLVLLSEQYTFTADDYRSARTHLSPGDYILLVNGDAGATGDAETRAKHDDIQIVSMSQLLVILARGRRE